MITFHAEIVIRMHISGWSAFRIEMTYLGTWTVLKAAAVGVGVTMSSTGGHVLNQAETNNPITENISGSIDVREGTVSDRP